MAMLFGLGGCLGQRGSLCLVGAGGASSRSHASLQQRSGKLRVVQHDNVGHGLREDPLSNLRRCLAVDRLPIDQHHAVSDQETRLCRTSLAPRRHDNKPGGTDKPRRKRSKLRRLSLEFEIRQSGHSCEHAARPSGDMRVSMRAYAARRAV